MSDRIDPQHSVHLPHAPLPEYYRSGDAAAREAFIRKTFDDTAVDYDRLEKILGGAFAAIWDTADRRKVPLRTAAFVVACERGLEARAERGLYP